MKSTKISCFFVSLLTVSSCANISADQLESMPDRSILWASNLVDDCMTFSGEYESVGESSVARSSIHEPPRLESDIFGVENLERDASSVRIEQDVESALHIFVEDENGNLLSTRKFRPPDSCDGSWVVYESSVKGSSGESSVSETNTVSKIAQSHDRALIVFVRVTTVSKGWVFLRKTNSYDVWYRFTGKNRRDVHLK